MTIKNIKDLIIKQKKEFFISFENNDIYLAEKTQEISGSINEYELLFLTLLTLLPPLFLVNYLSSFFLFITYIIFSFWVFSSFYVKMKLKKITKKLRDNESYRNEFLNYFLNPVFETKIIDDKMLQQVKLSLTLDQFKILKATNINGITYKILSDFINNIENINISLKEAEEEKYVLYQSDINKYIKLT